MVQPVFVDGEAVDQSAVAAVEILDLEAAVFFAMQKAVLARNGWVDHGNRIGRIPAQRDFTLREGND